MFGNLQGAFGIGSLIGILLGNRFESLKNPGMALTWLAYFLSFGLTSLAFVHQPWIAFAVMAGMGIGSGIVSIIAIVWLQQQTKQHMRGRIISLVMFVSIALDPFSQAISGFLSNISLTLLFLASGITMLLAALLASFHCVNEKSVKESLPYDS
ncbi:MFS transporter [bacterium]|nr:MFS transporter [bacterium]